MRPTGNNNFFEQFERTREEIARLKLSTPNIFPEWHCLKDAEDNLKRAEERLKRAQSVWEAL